MTAARICEGDIIIVRQQEQVEDGEIAVVMVDDNDATVKRFHRNGRTVTLTPQSYNPVHQVQVYDLKQTHIRIIGKVIRVVYDID
jgi:repressor LexA